MKFSKRTEQTNKPQLNVSLEIVVSLLLFLVSLVFCLCVGQKHFDTEEEVGFFISYWVPGAMGLLTLVDAGIYYIDDKKDSLWSKIAFVCVAIGELAICILVGHNYFAKYTLPSANSQFKNVARIIITAIAALNIMLRGIKFFPNIASKLNKNGIIAAISTLCSASLLAMGYAALRTFVDDVAELNGVDVPLFLSAFVISLTACAVSILTIFVLKDDIRLYVQAGATLVSAIFAVVAIIAFIAIREFTAGEFETDYWSLMSGGFAAITSLIAFGIISWQLPKRSNR